MHLSYEFDEAQLLASVSERIATKLVADTAFQNRLAHLISTDLRGAAEQSVMNGAIADRIVAKYTTDEVLRPKVIAALAAKQAESFDKLFEAERNDMLKDMRERFYARINPFIDDAIARAKPDIAERIRQRITKISEQMDTDWLKDVIQKYVEQRIREAFGRRAHELAGEFLTANKSRMGVLLSDEDLK